MPSMRATSSTVIRRSGSARATGSALATRRPSAFSAGRFSCGRPLERRFRNWTAGRAAAFAILAQHFGRDVNHRSWLPAKFADCAGTGIPRCPPSTERERRQPGFTRTSIPGSAPARH
jgi:hypothetical protein